MAVDWGNPTQVQQFRADALSKGIGGAQQVDDFIAQNQAAYKAQAGHQVQGIIGANQGALTPNQAQADPVGALSFIKGGGQLVNTGPDAQAKILNDAGSYFKSNVNKKTGYIDPQTFNKYLGDYGQAGGNTDDFINKLGAKYIDPNNINYDTPEAKAAQGALPLIKQVLDSYHNLKWTGQSVQDAAKIPIIGNYIKQQYEHAQTAHDALLQGEVARLRSIAGASGAQGFRSPSYLNSLADLLPDSATNNSTANDKMTQLDNLLKNTMGVKGGLKSLYGK